MERRSETRFFRWRSSSQRFAILDETDSGLDIDALKIVVARRQRDAQPGSLDARRHALPAPLELRSCPTSCIVLTEGRIVRSGGKELALELEEKGYGWLEAAAGAVPARAN